MTDADTKPCPFCAETIKAAAIKCKHCGSDIGGLDEDPCRKCGASAWQWVDGRRQSTTMGLLGALLMVAGLMLPMPLPVGIGMAVVGLVIAVAVTEPVRRLKCGDCNAQRRVEKR